MDKKMVYALLGGAAALVGAAVAFHYLTRGTEDETLDADLEQLGPLELDMNGRIEFRQFLKIFQICSFYGKTQFAEKKKQYVAQRREALRANDLRLYEEIVQKMTQEEEMLVQTKLNQIIDKLGITEEEFQKSTMYHGQDQHKGMQIMQMQQQTQGQGNDHPQLSRDKTI
jgi:hypothetical protein